MPSEHSTISKNNKQRIGGKKEKSQNPGFDSGRIWLSVQVCKANGQSFPKKKHKLMKKKVENPGIDPGTSRMLSERSTI